MLGKFLHFFCSFPRTVKKILEVSIQREYEFLSDNNKIMYMEVDLELELKIFRQELRVSLLHEFRLGYKTTEATSNTCSTMDKDVPSIRTAQHCFKNGNSYHPGGVLKGRCSVNKILFTEHLPFKTPPG